MKKTRAIVIERKGNNMKNIGKKLIAFLLCVSFCYSIIPIYAEGKEPYILDANFGGSNFRAIPEDGLLAKSEPTRGLTAYAFKSSKNYYIVGTGWNKGAKLWIRTSGGVGKMMYQWYTVDKEDIDLENRTFQLRSKNAITGANSDSYTTPKIKDLDIHYYCCVALDSIDNYATVLFEELAIVGRDNQVVSNTPNGVAVTGIYLSTIGDGFWIQDPETYELEWMDTYTYPMSYPTKYQIYRKTSGGSWESLRLIDSGGDDVVIDYTDRTTKMGTKYSYKYRAYVNGAWTTNSSATAISFNPFTDVSLDEPRSEYIAWAYNNSVVKGDGAGHFNPDDPCTRMNFVMILWKMHGKPSAKGSNPFTDVSGKTSINAVKWAVKKKIVKGTSSTTFSPNNNLSRMNIIMILWKLAGKPNVNGDNPFTDIEGDSTIKAVTWAVNKGIISGTSETEFSPNDNCSRALLVEILCKYNKLYKIL